MTHKYSRRIAHVYPTRFRAEQAWKEGLGYNWTALSANKTQLSINIAQDDAVTQVLYACVEREDRFRSQLFEEIYFHDCYSETIATSRRTS